MADRELIERTIAAIPEPDAAAAAAARAAMDAKAKPRGSLGRLEDLAVRVASIRRRPLARAADLQPTIVICAADHGVAEEGVSAYPQEVTGQMLRAFAGGQAAVCVLARQAGARLVVADLGVREPVEHPAILDRRVGPGTANFTGGPAMTREQAERALAAGIGLARDGVVALGEMGIGNTTAATALTAALLDVDPAEVCGRGTGVDDAGLTRKLDTVHRALTANPGVRPPYPAKHRAAPKDRPREAGGGQTPLVVLGGVGGFEIAALAGLVLGCAARRTPVVVDGFITAAAALVAVRLQPRAAGVLIAAHRSPEPGHAAILDALGLDPLLDLGMRLGEGSGAALALPLVRSAMAILDEMATFGDAGVSDAGA